MRFTFSVMAEWLCSALDTEPLRLHTPADAAVRGISAQTREEYEEDVLYLLDGKDLDALKGSCPQRMIAVLAPGEESELLTRPVPQSHSVLIVRTEKGKDACLELLHRCLAFYNDWYDNLLYVLQSGASWFSVVEEGHKVLRNPILLYDRSMKVLAYTREDGTDDEVWKDTIASGTARVENASQADELWKYVSKLDKNAKPFRHIGEGMSDPFYNCNVMVQGNRCGMITVIEYHAPLTPGQVELLQVFSDLIALRFREHDAQFLAEEGAGDRLLQDLLSGAITSQDRLSTRLIPSQWRYKTHFRLLVFTSKLSFLNDMHWKRNLEDLHRSGINGIGCVVHESHSHICYLYTSASEEIRPSSMDLLERYCASHQMRCGISNVYEDLLDTPHFVTQAVAALDLGRRDIVPYQEVRFARMIGYLKSAEYCEDLMHPAVLKLKELDETAGTEYLETLRCLLKNGLRQSDAARDLKIHRTTLIYRMKRIQELTGFAFSDSAELVHAAVSMEMV